jgi:predicted aconitase with swiveling domain
VHVRAAVFLKSSSKNSVPAAAPLLVKLTARPEVVQRASETVRGGVEVEGGAAVEVVALAPRSGDVVLGRLVVVDGGGGGAVGARWLHAAARTTTALTATSAEGSFIEPA